MLVSMDWAGDSYIKGVPKTMCQPSKDTIIARRQILEFCLLILHNPTISASISNRKCYLVRKIKSHAIYWNWKCIFFMNQLFLFQNNHKNFPNLDNNFPCIFYFKNGISDKLITFWWIFLDQIKFVLIFSIL